MRTKLLLITGLALVLNRAVTRAAKQTVNNLGDTGLSSQLRQKIAACQSGTNPGGTIEISGNHTTGGTGTRIFNVNAGAILALNNITISHGYSANGDGGAVSNFGTLNVNKSRFFSSETSASWSGSAILSWGPLNITDTEIAYNAGGGGVVKPRSSGAVTTITGSYFHDNSTNDAAGGGYGGAMQLHDAPSVTVDSTNFSNNSAPHGGAIYERAPRESTYRDACSG